MWPYADELVRILEAGVNVVTHRRVHQRPPASAPTATALVDACERGGSSLFGTGISPGFAELIGIATAGICDRIDKITINEAVRHHPLRLPRHRAARRLRPADRRPRAPGMAAEGTAVFGEAVAMVADALGVELDEIVCEAEYAQTTEDVVMDSWTIPAGCVAGVAASWQGRVGGRTVVELNVRWKKGQTLDPDWQIEDGHVIQVDGRPTVRVEARVPPAARLRGHDVRRLHGAGQHHDRDAGDQRDPGRGRRPAGHRHLHRSAAAPAPGTRPSLRSRCRASRSSRNLTRSRKPILLYFGVAGYPTCPAPCSGRALGRREQWVRHQAFTRVVGVAHLLQLATDLHDREGRPAHPYP